MEKTSKLLQILGLSLLTAVTPIHTSRAEETRTNVPTAETHSLQMNFCVDQIPEDYLSSEFYEKPNHGVWQQIVTRIEDVYKAQGIAVKFNFVDETTRLLTERDNQNFVGIYTSPEYLNTNWQEYLSDAGQGSYVGKMNGLISMTKNDKNITREEAEKEVFEREVSPLLRGNRIASGFKSGKSVYLFSGINDLIRDHSDLNPDRIVARVLEHEIDHTCGLGHMPANSTNYINIMSSPTYDSENRWLREGTNMTPQQIEKIKQNKKEKIRYKN